jgi:hypothetical protein
MKKQASPVPSPRAAALSQSASRFSAGATSTWQYIVGNSPRLAVAGRRASSATHEAAPLALPSAPGARRVAVEPQRAVGLSVPAAEPDTLRQVGWREANRAVGMSTKRKYNLLGIGFGPKVSVFETEKVKLPVYQETNRHKRYYAAVKAENVARIKREGFQPEPGEGTAPKTIEQFNARGHSYFFGSEAGAQSYAKANLKGSYAIIAFVMPEYQDFTPDMAASPEVGKPSKAQLLRTAQHIPAQSIRGAKTSVVAKEIQAEH